MFPRQAEKCAMSDWCARRLKSPARGWTSGEPAECWRGVASAAMVTVASRWKLRKLTQRASGTSDSCCCFAAKRCGRGTTRSDGEEFSEQLGPNNQADRSYCR